MFEKVFKNLINDGIVTKTKYFYMLDNQGDSIYKVKRGYKKVLKEVLNKGLNFQEIRKIKWILFYMITILSVVLSK